VKNLDLERFLVKYIARLGPWLTPLLPAYFIQRALQSRLDVHWAWAWIGAFALETVGIAAVFVLIDMHQYNLSKRKSDPPAQVGWAIVATVAYYVTAFLLVLFVEFIPDVIKFAPAAYVILGGSSAGILGLMANHRAMLEKIEGEKAERKSRTKSDKIGHQTDILPTVNRTEWVTVQPDNIQHFKQLVREQVIILPDGITGPQMVKAFDNVHNDRTGLRWRDAARSDNGSTSVI